MGRALSSEPSGKPFVCVGQRIDYAACIRPLRVRFPLRSTKEWKEFDGLPASKVYDWQGVNNGVMLWRLDRIRAHLAEYWEEIMRIIREKAYRSSRFAGFHTKLPDNVMKQ